MSGRLRLTSYVLLGIVCGSLILNAAASFNFAPLVIQYEPPGFNSFKSRAELAWFLEEKAKVTENNWRVFGGVTGGIVSFDSTFAIVASAATAAKSAAQGAGDYSTTNIQVAGVDEADVVKTDGTYIYLSKGDTVYIVLAYPAEEARLLTKIKFDVEVSDLFVAGDKLVVFTQG